MSTIVRPVTAGDRTDWERLWTDYLAFYQTELPPEQFDLQFSRILAPEGTIRGLLAERDGEIAGVVHFLFHAHGWQEQDVCYLQDLYVDPAFRRRGVARDLIEAVYQAADRKGASNVYWMTQTFNETARRIYDRIGRVTPFIKYQRH